MTEAEAVELQESLVSLGLTPKQQAELEADPERAWGWVVWARDKRLTNPAATILTKFRSGVTAPDPNAWRGGQAGAAPNYAKLLEACDLLVRNTAHEYRDEDLLEEFEKISRSRRGGNGAMLTDADRERLLHDAAAIRARQPEPDVDLEDRVLWAVTYYAKLLARKTITEALLKTIQAERWSDVPDFAERVRAFAEELKERAQRVVRGGYTPSGRTADAPPVPTVEEQEHWSLPSLLDGRELAVAHTTTNGKEEHVDLDF